MKKLFGKGKWLVLIISVLFYFWINERMLASQLVSFYSEKVGIGYQCGIILMMLSFAYCLLNIKKLPSLKSVETAIFMALLIYMNIIGFAVAFFTSNIDYSMLLGIAPPFLYYLMFGLTARNDLSHFVAICMFAVLLVLFYNFNASLTVLAEQWNTDSFEGGSASYFILLIIPFALCCKWKWVRYLSLLVGIAVIVTSTKRGGAVAVVLMTIGYSYVEALTSPNRHLKMKKALNIVILSILIFAVVFFIAESDILREVAVFERFKEIRSDGGSGRDAIWSQVVKMIFGSNIFAFIFGHGYGAVVLDSPYHTSAHNDYLEAFYDYGFVGLALLLLSLLRLISLNINLIKSKSLYSAPLTASIILFVVLSFISHILIYFANLSILAMFWGYIAGITRQEKTAAFHKKYALNTKSA